MTSALVLCRTPFQARLIDKVLCEERVDHFNLLYFTQQNSPEDRHYFAALSRRSAHAELVHVPPERFDLLNYIRLRLHAGSLMRDLHCEIVILASIDNFVFNAIARRQRGAELVTVDDGLGNIVASGSYRKTLFGGRGDAYRWMFGASSLREIRERIVRHYTIFPQFDNIVSRDRLRFIDLRTPEFSDSQGSVFFIGQPFHEVLTPEQISRMTAYLREQKIDFYVRHPREVELLDIGAPEFDKRGLIAEDAIMNACSRSKPTIIGLTTSVLFSIPSGSAIKTMLVFKEAEMLAEAVELGRAVGCKISLVP